MSTSAQAIPGLMELGRKNQAGGYVGIDGSGLVAGLSAAQGQRVMVADLIPPSWKPYMMDRQAAISQGWIAGPQEELE